MRHDESSVGVGRLSSRALSDEGSGVESARGDVLGPHHPVEAAAVAPHHLGGIVGVDLQERRPPPCFVTERGGRDAVAESLERHLKFDGSLYRLGVSSEVVQWVTEVVTHLDAKRSLANASAMSCRSTAGNCAVARIKAGWYSPGPVATSSAVSLTSG
jgi:hypothetical protein